MHRCLFTMPKVYANAQRRTISSALACVESLRGTIGHENVLTEDIEKYTTDWLKAYSGGAVVCLPRSVSDVSAILKICHSSNVGIVPQGGNTGLVGGGVGMQEELILSLERMNTVLSVDKNSAVLTCEAGCVLEVLEQQMNAEFGLSIPLDLGARGACMIGGNVATNAGGVRVVKYGSMHHNVLGLEVVLADGTVMNELLRSLPKDNCGYPLKHMFIGSEGTLGVITKVSIQLVPMPSATNVLVGKVPSFTSVFSILQMARRELFDCLSAFEYMDKHCIRALREFNPVLVDCDKYGDAMFDTTSVDKDMYVLLEVSKFGTHHEDMSANRRLESLATVLLEQGLLEDAILSQDSVQSQALWKIRETVPVALLNLTRTPTPPASSRTPEVPHRYGKLFKYDISLSLGDMHHLVDAVCQDLRELEYYRILVQDYSFNVNSDNEGTASPYSTDSSDVECEETVTAISLMKKAFQSNPIELEICCFGHMGDQNLHFNVMLREFPEPSGGWSATSSILEENVIGYVQSDLDRIIYRHTLRRQGSVSAEHGIGLSKKHMMPYCRSPTELRIMKSFKTLLDPLNIMNPGKLFDHPGL